MSNTVEAWSRTSGAQAAQDLFVKTFGIQPQGVWAAPGRVNLIGEHVDYNGGPCLPIALPHATYAAASRRNDTKLRVVSAQEEGIRELDTTQVGPGKVSGWPAYVAGVIWALEQQGYQLGGFDLAITSCVPYGAGLSSSAALEAAAAFAVCDLVGLDLNEVSLLEQIVSCCIRAENEIAGANTGGLDQTASILSSAGHALFVDFHQGKRENIPFDLASQDLTLLVIDTRAAHSLNDGQYAQRRATCEQAARILGVNCLAEVTDAQEALERLAREEAPLLARVRHVLGEIQRTRQAVELMKQGPLSGKRLQQLGQLFDQSHDSLRDDYQVTCPELDLAVDTARELGAHGARMTGGGFGGSAIAIVPNQKVDLFRQGISDQFAKQQMNQPQFLFAYAGKPAARVV